MVTASHTLMNQAHLWTSYYMHNRNYRHHSNQNNTRLVHDLCFNPFKGCDSLYFKFSFSGNMSKQSHVWPCFHICLNIISHDKLTRQEKNTKKKQTKKTTKTTSTQQNPAVGRTHFLPPRMGADYQSLLTRSQMSLPADRWRCAGKQTAAMSDWAD